MTSEALAARAAVLVLRRQTRWLNLLLLAGVVGAHVLAFALLVPLQPDVGRITPVLRHPVRVRLLEGTASTVVSSMTTDRSALTVPVSASPEALIPEGRIEVAPENYAASSDRYFTVTELGQRPSAITLPSLDPLTISPLARGTVVLRLYINETGTVDRIEVDDSTVSPEILAKLLALRDQLQFTPGVRNGANVKSLVTYAVDLTPAEVTTLVSRAKASPP